MPAHTHPVFVSALLSAAEAVVLDRADFVASDGTRTTMRQLLAVAVADVLQERIDFAGCSAAEVERLRARLVAVNAHR